MTAPVDRPHKKTGRPSAFKPEYVKQAADLCGLGATDEQLAQFFGVNVRRIYAWKKANPEFQQAIKSAKDDLDRKVERSLFERAMGYKHKAVKIFQYEGSPVIVPYTEIYPPDTAAMIFWLKNRQPKRWREQHHIEAQVVSGLPNEVVERLSAAFRHKTGLVPNGES